MFCRKCGKDLPEASRFCDRCGYEFATSAPDEQDSPSSGELQPGMVISGKYRIDGEIGRGGMAVVYMAADQSLERPVALKVLPPQLTFDRDFVNRFLREARAAAKLQHPNIVTIYEAGESRGIYFIAMSFIEGETLAGRLARGPMPESETLRVIKRIASALDHAHARGVIHRDIKPGNVMMRAGDSEPVLMDFGIAKAADARGTTRTGMAIGTPEYMSPEQIEGGEAGPSSDLYSLGVVMYQMLCGEPPFSGPTASVLYKHVHTPPPFLRDKNPSVSPGLAGIVHKLLAKTPQDRFQSGEELISALESKERFESFSPGVPGAKAPASTRVLPSTDKGSAPPGSKLWAVPQPFGTLPERAVVYPTLRTGEKKRTAALVLAGISGLLGVAAITLALALPRAGTGGGGRKPSPPGTSTVGPASPPGSNVVQPPPVEPESNDTIKDIVNSISRQATVEGIQLYSGIVITKDLKVPYSLDVDDNGWIYIVDDYQAGIVKVSPDGKISLLNTAVKLVFPTDVVCSGGDFYVVDFSRKINRVFKFNNQGGKVLELGSGAITFSHPKAAVLDSRGNLYVADRDNNRIVKFDTSGKLITTIKLGRNYSEPNGVAVDSVGDLWVTLKTPGKLLKIVNDEKITEVLIKNNDGSRYSLSLPGGIDADNGKRLFIADTGNERVVVIDRDGNLIRRLEEKEMPGSLEHPPEGLRVGPKNDYLYVVGGNMNNYNPADDPRTHGILWRVKIYTRESTAVGPASPPGSNTGQPPPADNTMGPEKPTCAPTEKTDCFEGNIYTIDSCGERVLLRTQCGEHSACRISGGSAVCACESGYVLRNGNCALPENMRASKRCEGNTLYWFGDLGTRGEEIERCDGDKMTCTPAGCGCSQGWEMKGGQCREKPKRAPKIEPSRPAAPPQGMAYIPAGEFWMGCSPGDNDCNNDEKPRVKVYVDGFWMDKYEVTQGDYKRVMGSNPSYFISCGDNCPVESVSWNDAKTYCRKGGKRLPTEAEWEFAARGGSGSRYYWGGNMNGEYAWYNNNSWSTTHPVGQRMQNGYGLYDMLGNVWEWVEDCYESGWYGKLSSGQRNPLNSSTGFGTKVFRGGSWYNLASNLRVSLRYRLYPVNRGDALGFRCSQD